MTLSTKQKIILWVTVTLIVIFLGLDTKYGKERDRNVRDAFAHGDEINSKRYYYDNISIFTQRGIDRLIIDYGKATAEWEKLFKMDEPKIEK